MGEAKGGKSITGSCLPLGLTQKGKMNIKFSRRVVVENFGSVNNISPELERKVQEAIRQVAKNNYHDMIHGCITLRKSQYRVL